MHILTLVFLYEYVSTCLSVCVCVLERENYWIRTEISGKINITLLERRKGRLKKL
jgi:hypothetical protein